MAGRWLDDFLQYSSYGECPRKYLFWVGVSTIAGALRRKVWIDQVTFQWTPNFYVLLVGPPGVKKSTSINMGLDLLKRVPEIDFGPQIVTWQQMISHMADARQTFKIGEKDFDASCCTIGISEFGTFFDPLNRELVDNLTDIWDGKLGTIKKETKTSGCDEVINPWLNICAGTTPGWVGTHFSEKLVRSGFASRPLYVYADKPETFIAYPSRNVPPDPRTRAEIEGELVTRLCEFAQLNGDFMMTEEAYRWGEKWYIDYRTWQATLGSSMEAGFYERQQTHLHKLAMVLCVSRGGFPTITLADMVEADRHLRTLEPDVRIVFGQVGQTRLSHAASEIIEVMGKHKSVRKGELYRRYFFRTMSGDEFEVALKSAQQAGLITLTGPLHDMQVVFIEPTEESAKAHADEHAEQEDKDQQVV